MKNKIVKKVGNKKGGAITKPKLKIAKPLPGIDGLIQTALQSKSGVEHLKELMKMKYEHEARESAKLFNEKFYQMQSVLPVIRKTKDGAKTKSGKVAFKYAPLEQIIKQIKPSLNRYGFSYHWTETFIEKGVKRINCHITGHGHERIGFVDIPIIPAGNNTLITEIQRYGSTITYGKRYSLIGVLGIMADNDDDGKSAVKIENPADSKLWGKEEHAEWEKISKACTILNISGKKLLEEIQSTKPHIKQYDQLKIEELKLINNNLSGRIDSMESGK